VRRAFSRHIVPRKIPSACHASVRFGSIRQPDALIIHVSFSPAGPDGRQAAIVLLFFSHVFIFFLVPFFQNKNYIRRPPGVFVAVT
jgi:hypothetical protein